MLFDVCIPQGSVPGSTFHAHVNGTVVAVRVPDGCFAGQMIRIDVQVAQQAVAAAGTGVWINDGEIAAATLRNMPGLQTLPRGRYWHDPACGAWGSVNGPCLGVFAGGMRIPGSGSLKPNASGGRTGVFVNGRELHLMDVASFRALGVQCLPGKWTIDALGIIRMEGSLFPVGQVSLAATAQRRNGIPGGILSTYDKCGAAVM